MQFINTNTSVYLQPNSVINTSNPSQVAQTMNRYTPFSILDTDLSQPLVTKKDNICYHKNPLHNDISWFFIGFNGYMDDSNLDH